MQGRPPRGYQIFNLTRPNSRFLTFGHAHWSISAQAGRWADARAALAEAVAAGLDLPTSLYYNYGVACLKCEDLAAARAAFEELIAYAPNYGLAYDALATIDAREGAAACQRGDFGAAIPLLSAAAGRTPKGTTLYNLGLALLKERRAPEAERTFARLEESEPDHARAGRVRGRVDVVPTPPALQARGVRARRGHGGRERAQRRAERGLLVALRGARRGGARRRRALRRRRRANRLGDDLARRRLAVQGRDAEDGVAGAEADGEGQHGGPAHCVDAAAIACDSSRRASRRGAPPGGAGSPDENG